MEDNFDENDIDCECEDTPLIVYCKKCGRIHIVANEQVRIQITYENEIVLKKILKEELKDNYSFFAEMQEYDDGD